MSLGVVGARREVGDGYARLFDAEAGAGPEPILGVRERGTRTAARRISSEIYWKRVIELCTFTPVAIRLQRAVKRAYLVIDKSKSKVTFTYEPGNRSARRHGRGVEQSARAEVVQGRVTAVFPREYF